MKTYLKCLWWNKAMGLSWICIINSIIIIILDLLYHINIINTYVLISLILFFISIITIIWCENGKHTIDTYKRHLEILQYNKYHFIYPYWYCDRQGIKWAKYEYNKKIKKNCK